MAAAVGAVALPGQGSAPGRQDAIAGRRRRRRRQAIPYALILPGLAFYAIFTIYPVFKQAEISFYNWHVVPGAHNPFVGLSNYAKLFADPVVLTAVRNTLLYVVVTVPAQLLLGLAAAHVVHERLPAKNLWRTLIFIPVVTSWVIVSYLFAYIFNAQGGLANQVLSAVVGHHVAVLWLENTWTANTVIWLLAVWKGLGWAFVMFLAALTTVPRELVEAGRVDGARGRRLWWHIVLPSIRATFVFVLVLLVIGAFQVFISVFLLTSGGPINSTQVLLTYAYQQAFQFFDFGYAAALATLIAMVLLSVSIVEIRLLRRDV